MNGYFGAHYFGRFFSRKGPAPVDRLIIVGAGEITCAAGSSARINSNRRGRIETRQCAVEEFLKIVDTLPQPMGAIVAECARAGIRRGQGRSGAPKSLAEKTACETAMGEAPQFFRQYLAEAKASGTHLHPHRWAKEKTAEAVRRRMIELGARKPPAVATIKKRMKLRS